MGRKMAAPNSNKTPAALSNSNSMLPFDHLVAWLWVAVPVGLFGIRHMVAPAFSDFEVVVPTVVQLFLRLSTLVLFTIVAVIVLLVFFLGPRSTPHRIFMQVAGVGGLLVVLVCVLSFFWPMVRLLNELG